MNLNWEGYEVPTREATWVCIESKSIPTAGTADGIDYLLKFEAKASGTAGIPAARRLHLRTSEFRVSEEPRFLGFLTLVVDGQLLQTTPWDRFVEVMERG